MGSILSALYDDMDTYSELCKHYNEKEDEVYSNHYYWLIGKKDGKIAINFKEYDRLQKIKKNKNKIDSYRRDIKQMQNKIKELQKENHSLIYKK